VRGMRANGRDVMQATVHGDTVRLSCVRVRLRMSHLVTCERGAQNPLMYVRRVSMTMRMNHEHSKRIESH